MAGGAGPQGLAVGCWGTRTPGTFAGPRPQIRDVSFLRGNLESFWKFTGISGEIPESSVFLRLSAVRNTQNDATYGLSTRIFVSYFRIRGSPAAGDNGLKLPDKQSTQIGSGLILPQNALRFYQILPDLCNRNPTASLTSLPPVGPVGSLELRRRASLRATANASCSNGARHCSGKDPSNSQPELDGIWIVWIVWIDSRHCGHHHHQHHQHHVHQHYNNHHHQHHQTLIDDLQ